MLTYLPRSDISTSPKAEGRPSLASERRFRFFGPIKCHEKLCSLRIKGGGNIAGTAHYTGVLHMLGVNMEEERGH